MRYRFLASLFIFFIFTDVITLCAFGKMKVPGRTTHWVNDYAELIDRETEAYLEGIISSIEQKTPDPVEIIIATFDTLGGWSPEEFALEYGEKWRRTKKGRDNGVILLVLPSGGGYRIHIGVGQNLRGILTNKIVKGLVQDVILPEFKVGRYQDGLKRATEILIRILDDAKIPTDEPTLLSRIIAGGIIIGCIFMLLWRRFLRKKLHG